MRLTSALISSLFASAVLADHPSQLSHRAQPTYVGKAGAVLSKSPATFKSVSATLEIPSVSGDKGSGATALVSIDGDTCGSVSLRAGVDFTIEDAGPSYRAWYQRYPAEKQFYSNVAVSAGKTITLNVTALSATSGFAIVDGVRSPPLHSSHPLCEQNAQWIVDLLEQDGRSLPLIDFETVTFTDARAADAERTYTPGDGAAIVDILDSDGLLRSSVLIDGAQVSISYQ